jgi:hypothetical protein
MLGPKSPLFVAIFSVLAPKPFLPQKKVGNAAVTAAALSPWRPHCLL